MVFPSVPVYLDHHSSWLQQQAGDSVIENLQLAPVPPSHGDGGTVEIRPCSMSERARLAKLPYPEAQLKCPRCESTNTKFCYFNNYSLSQPRHFCKSCRRYWTRGGALRDVPVGGGCRRSTSKKSKASQSKSPITSTTSTPISSNTCSMMNKFVTNSSMYSNLPIFPSLPNLPESQDAAGGNELGFPIHKPSTNTGTLNFPAAFGDQWMPSSHHLNFSGRFDQPAGTYNFEREAINQLVYDDQAGFGQLSSSLKQEENQGSNLSRNFMRFSGNDQYWSGNMWKDLSAAASSASHFM